MDIPVCVRVCKCLSHYTVFSLLLREGVVLAVLYWYMLVYLMIFILPRSIEGKYILYSILIVAYFTVTVTFYLDLWDKHRPYT